MRKFTESLYLIEYVRFARIACDRPIIVACAAQNPENDGNPPADCLHERNPLMLRSLFLCAALLVPRAFTVAADAPVDFNRDVRPILSNTCYACHGPDEQARKADLRLDTRAGAIAGKVLVPGKPGESELLRRVLTDDADEQMPPPKFGKKLTAAEKDILRRWIAQGGQYAVHWSYAQPVRPTLPRLAKPNPLLRNPIDHFIEARLNPESLTLQPEADRTTLARRVALDLTGLPPTPAEVTAFLADRSAGAYERYVDRLLAKSAFGEHWARMWLDLARYADSAGYADDPARTIWAFRDYVIRSMNANKPFDQFTIEQIAGDLLPNPTEEQLVATAFHRNTLTNNEGGTNDEEFRNAAVVDRVNTTMVVWMGTSMACVQCHTHKYDPLTQTEYYQFFAFFNNTADADKRDESPLTNVGDTPEKQTRRFQIEKDAAALERIDTRYPALIQAAQKARAAQLRKELPRYQPVTTVPIFRELEGKARRTTKIQLRGNFLDTGDVVTEGVPAVFPPLPKGAPLNRLTLARWLVSPENPLTGRVTVNRFWGQIFGTGLVRTPEEFGSQGEPPTHPQLLDWLAVEFVDSGWDMKKLLKLMVTSGTYRQSGRVTPELLAKDPDNALLSRGPRFRLSAEMVRDQALAVSGLLSAKMYGPSVKPPQPAFGLSAAFGSSMDWKTSTGDDRYRRGLYTEWRRTNPYPSMTAFDAPSREACTIRRVRTNTPLQALVTLNDPVYVECAQALARKMLSAGATPAERVAAGFRACLMRAPTNPESARLVQLYEAARSQYASNLADAVKLATDPLGPLPPGVSASETAAWTVVANVLLNLDEMFLKR